MRITPDRLPAARAALAAAVLAMAFFALTPARAVAASQADTNHLASTKRVSFIVLPPRNATGKTNQDDLFYLLGGLLSAQVERLKPLEIVPNDTVGFAEKHLGLKSGADLNPDQIRRLGELAGAQRVLWGSYSYQGGQPSMSLQALNVQRDGAVVSSTATGRDWRAACLDVLCKVLPLTGIELTEADRKIMEVPARSSTNVLELLSHVYATSAKGLPLPVQAEYLRQALALAPQSEESILGMARVQMLTGEEDAAKRAARQVLESDPDSAQAHWILGMVYYMQDLNFFAREELLSAVRLKENSTCYNDLGRLYRRLDQWDNAESAFRKATLLAPFYAAYHANLGTVLAHSGKGDEARAELALAESFQPSPEPSDEIALAEAYDMLNDAPPAAEHYQKALAKLKSLGASDLGDREAHLKELQARLVPTLVPGQPPRTLTAAEIREALQTRLTPAERGRAIDPLATTPEMTAWVRQFVSATLSDRERGLQLFQKLNQHVDRGSPGGKLTAAQSFKDLTNPEASLTCQDYALLYVALARELGLHSCFVRVNQDCRGKYVLHACAAIFVEGKALLVDPTYHWFGVAHRRFRFLDDLSVRALYLCQLSDLASSETAFKLAPDSADVVLGSAIQLAEAGQVEKAELRLGLALGLHPDEWLGDFARGVVAGCKRQFAQAEKCYRDSLRFDIDYPQIHRDLGEALVEQGKWAEARVEIEAYLKSDIGPDDALACRRILSLIDEALAKDR